MQDNFVLDLKAVSHLHQFNETVSFSLNLFVKEKEILDGAGHKIKQTALLEVEPNERHFKMLNRTQTKVIHICIDGDFILFGQPKYDWCSAKTKDGRPDSLIFTQNRLVFLELKVEQEEATFGKKDDVKWTTFFKGLAQIEDFVRFLHHNDINVRTYFSEVVAVICMRFEPIFRSNTRRNTELLRRATALGFRIQPPHNHLEIFNIE